MSSESLHVLHPRSEAAMKCIRNTAEALRSVAPPRGGSGGSEPISRDDVRNGTRLYLESDDVAHDNLRMMGEELSSLVDSLDASLEQHFTDFFAHLKRGHEQELALWVRSSTAIKEDQAAQIVSPSAAPQPPPLLASQQQQQKLQNRPSEHAMHAATQQAEEVQRDMSFLSLQSWLLIELESLVSILNVEKVATYFFNPINPDFLRLAAVIPRNIVAATGDPQAAPKEISSASHSILTTVASTGVGASIVRDSALHPTTPRGEISFDKCICMPLFSGRGTDSSAAVGCIMVANKLNGRDFELADELRVWAFCSSASGVFQRYSTEFFVPPPIATGGETSRTRAAAGRNGTATAHATSNKRSMVCNVDHLHSRIWLGLDSAASLPGITHEAGVSSSSVAAMASKLKASGVAPSNNSTSLVSSGRRKKQVTYSQAPASLTSSRQQLPQRHNNNSSSRVAPTSPSRILLAPLSSTAASGSNASGNSSSDQKTPSSHNKIPVIRAGTLAEAAIAKMRITGAGALTFGNGPASPSSVVAASTFNKMEQPINDHDLLDGRSHEEVIESVAPYLRNLEGLWRKALDECARMKNECSQWRTQVEVKDSKIIELEVALRHLTRQVGAMQTDVDALRQAVPDTLAVMGKM